MKLLAALALAIQLAACAAGSVADIPPGATFRDCDHCPEMVVVPAGSFLMGSPPTEAGRFPDESPQHRVTFAREFAVGKFPVTRAEYARFVQESGYRAGPGCLIRKFGGWIDDPRADWRTPGFAQTARDPVVCMNVDDAMAYTAWLSRKTGYAYRLLAEAEWEYAARAGSSGAYPWGAEANHDRANFGAEPCCEPATEGRDRWLHTSPAGSFPPNAFGLYDMHGNAWQWTQDCWYRNYDGAPTDGSARVSGSCVDHVLRGGSWNCSAATVRSAEREVHDASGRYAVVGFRVARPY
ncbi:MAG TPA: formylglycine-generating enzyme family protein [Burkholderiales bacterium]|nr:formylglycine-generating enzyme family protein [Burkholderiales bacterium]